MPHECTNCGREFEDGSKEMLSGCPDCGGTKFQFVPAAETGPAAGSASTGDAGPSREGPTSGRTRPREHTGKSTDSRGDDQSWPAIATSEDDRSSAGDFSEWPDSARRPEDRSGTDNSIAGTESSTDLADADQPSTLPDTGPGRQNEAVPADHEPAGDGSENTAQADARSEVVSSEELSEMSDSATDVADPEYGRVVSEPSDENPSLEQLREELNDQFESIKILSPGQYELNLMELYDREEYIVSLQEDGRYVIDVPESWHDEG